ncbi:unnamed protein product, partial [Prorocentrum cordatum]
MPVLHAECGGDAECRRCDVWITSRAAACAATIRTEARVDCNSLSKKGKYVPTGCNSTTLTLCFGRRRRRRGPSGAAFRGAGPPPTAGPPRLYAPPRGGWRWLCISGWLPSSPGSLRGAPGRGPPRRARAARAPPQRR